MKWWDEQCTAVENERQGKMNLLYRKLTATVNYNRIEEKSRVYVYVIKKVMC